MTDMSVVIIDSGGANIASLEFALQRLQVPVTLSADADVIRGASHVLLPGVGAAGDAMARLRAAGLAQIIPDLTQPVLGICLGMQLLFDRSAENDTNCLGIIRGEVRRIPMMAGHPVPHMGWNMLQPLRDSPLTAGIGAQGRHAYFVHSYALDVGDCTTTACEYGIEFSACVQQDNFFGTQFHPERSSQLGAQLLRNFLQIH